MNIYVKLLFISAAWDTRVMAQADVVAHPCVVVEADQAMVAVIATGTSMVAVDMTTGTNTKAAMEITMTTMATTLTLLFMVGVEGTDVGLVEGGGVEQGAWE